MYGDVPCLAPKGHESWTRKFVRCLTVTSLRRIALSALGLDDHAADLEQRLRQGRVA
jgi:hypothetical protein